MPTRHLCQVGIESYDRGMKKKYPSEEQERFIVRFPDGMRDRIAGLAKAAGRTMNAEIVQRLEQTLIREAFDPLDFEELETQSRYYVAMHQAELIQLQLEEAIAANGNSPSAAESLRAAFPELMKQRDDVRALVTELRSANISLMRRRTARKSGPEPAGGANAK